MESKKLCRVRHAGQSEEGIAWKKEMAKKQKECDVPSPKESKKLKFRIQP